MINREFEAYRDGAAAYHKGVDENPHDPNTDYDVWSAWFDGYGDEQRRDTEAKIGECAS